MARSLHPEFFGMPYHVTARGNALEDFLDDEDRHDFLDLLGRENRSARLAVAMPTA
jgi:hypothetical protein